MIQFKRLDHILVTIPVGKKEEARHFYGSVLKLQEIPGEHPKGAIWYEIGDIELHLREENGNNLSDRHPAFEVANLDEAKQYLELNRVPIAYSSEIGGRQRFFFRDPFDNRIELLQFVNESPHYL